MNLQALSGAASIAFVSTFIFLLLAKCWYAIAKSIGSTGSFQDSIMVEAAQRLRDEMNSLTRLMYVYLSCGLVFVIIFSVSYLLRPGEVFSNVPKWGLTLIVTVLGGVSLYAAFRFFKVLLAMRRTEFVRDANIAAGHGLQKLTADRNRVFHDVPCGAGTIDNVIVGLHGVYAIHVVAQRPRKDNRVRLDGDDLLFAPGNHAVSLKEFAQGTLRLAREFHEILKHDVRVRSVVAVPGWEIESQASDNHLIVNERNLAMLRGWKDQNDYLMNEEVETLQQVLTERCKRA